MVQQNIIFEIVEKQYLTTVEYKSVSRRVPNATIKTENLK